jgi:prevent-host-death family protein
MNAPMLKIPEAEAATNFSLYQDRALTQPVAITHEGEPRIVMISIEEYERLKRRDRQALRVEELTDEELALIAAAEPPEDAKRFDHEVR